MKTLAKVVIGAGIILAPILANAQKGQYSDNSTSNAMKNKYSNELKQKGKSTKESPSPFLEKHTPYHPTGNLNHNDYPFKFNPLILSNQAYVLYIKSQDDIIIAPAENEYVRIKLTNPSGKGNEIQWIKPYQFKQLHKNGNLVTSVSIDDIFTGPTNIRGEETEQNYSRAYTVLWLNPKTGESYTTTENITGPREKSQPEQKETKKSKKVSKNPEIDKNQSSINPDDFIPYVYLRANDGLPADEETLKIYLMPWDENFTQILPIVRDGKTKIELDASKILYATRTTLEQQAQTGTGASIISPAKKSIEDSINNSLKKDMPNYQNKVINLDSLKEKQGFKPYMIRKEDTWKSIAKKLITSPDSLKKWNFETVPVGTEKPTPGSKIYVRYPIIHPKK